MRRLIGWCGVGCLVLAATVGCGDPDQQLRSDGARAARDAASAVGAARLAGQSFIDHKLWSQSATQLVSEAEKSLGQVGSTFDQQQPKSASSRKTYDDISKTLNDAEGNVTDLRIALVNDDLEGVTSAVRQLGQAADELRQVGETAK
jgi:hypothetical protein